MKAIFHLHTNISKCAALTEEELAFFCKKENIKLLFLTNHNKITKLEIPGVITPLGEEIDTGEGEIIGIFLAKEIKPGLGIKKTISEIKKQGGLVVAPHPLDIIRREAMGIKNFNKYMQSFDLVEGFNSRAIMGLADLTARKKARKSNVLTLPAADAHFLNELNNSIFEIDEFTTPADFLGAVKKIRNIRTKRGGLAPHLMTYKEKLFKSCSGDDINA